MAANVVGMQNQDAHMGTKVRADRLVCSGYSGSLHTPAPLVFLPSGTMEGKLPLTGILSGFFGIIDAANIGVTVENGIVTLTGHVHSYVEKHTAEHVAQWGEGCARNCGRNRRKVLT